MKWVVKLTCGSCITKAPLNDNLVNDNLVTIVFTVTAFDAETQKQAVGLSMDSYTLDNLYGVRGRGVSVLDSGAERPRPGGK